MTEQAGTQANYGRDRSRRPSPKLIWFLVACASIGLHLSCGSAAEATVPAAFAETVVVSALGGSPTAMDIAPDGRIFVAIQTGEVRVVENGVLLPQAFLTVATQVGGERGLVGVVCDPQFAENGYVYVFYTVPTPPRHNRVSRFTANGNVAAENSETIIVELDTLSSSIFHNGGGLHFGQDGKLYISSGDNGNGDNAQTLGNRFGKMLRYNRDGSIPDDNPFYNTAAGANRAIWAVGLRNPFTFAFGAPDRMFINDVGQDSWEEINDGIGGSNYGWPGTEGATSNPRFRGPLFTYPHGPGSSSGCAITAGVFYDPPSEHFPASYRGKYFFADYCNGWIHVLDPATNTVDEFAMGLAAVVDLDISPDGRLYYLSRGNGGQVVKIQSTASVTAIAGTPQATGINHPFATPFSVLVLDTERRPVADVVVTFSAPLDGPSGRFPSGLSSATATTGSDGVATAPAFTANGLAGSYNVDARVAGGNQRPTFVVTNTKGEAAVALGDLVQTYDGAPKPVGVATTPAGLPVTVRYNGSTEAPTETGTYQVEATVTDPNYDGSTSGALVIEPASTSTETPAPQTTPSPTATGTSTPVPAQPLNLSTRAHVSSGEDVTIAGFIITGSAPKRVMLRAIGPSLSGHGIADVLADPRLDLHGADRELIATNNNWQDVQKQSIEESQLAPPEDAEAALIATLQPGAYTAVVRGNDDGTGIGLVEVYDLEPGNTARLANISSRASVESGANVLIAGFILGGGEGGGTVIALRGIGPSLGARGVSNPLPDPKLELRDAHGALLRANDNWDEAAEAEELVAHGLAPRDTREAAMLVTLPPGAYTAIVADKTGRFGVGVVELYNIR